VCDSAEMAQEVCVTVSAADRAHLVAIIDDRNRPLKHIQRAQIILFSADRLPVLQVAQRAGTSRPAVWRWQKRYAEAGVEGLLRDKTRPPGRKPVPTATVARVLALTQSEPLGEATHWTGRAMAKAVGLSLRAVQRIWEAHRLQPHRIRTFKRSNDPAFAEKVEDVVGLYMHPPAQTTTPRTPTQRSKRGSPGTRAGPSTSLRNPAPGSMPSKASSPNSPASAFDAACSDQSSTFRPPSTVTSRSTTMTPNHSSGPNPPTPSSPSSADCLYLPFESVH
jgi:transposase